MRLRIFFRGDSRAHNFGVPEHWNNAVAAQLRSGKDIDFHDFDGKQISINREHMLYGILEKE